MSIKSASEFSIFRTREKIINDVWNFPRIIKNCQLEERSEWASRRKENHLLSFVFLECRCLFSFSFFFRLKTKTHVSNDDRYVDKKNAKWNISLNVFSFILEEYENLRSGM